MCVCDLALAVNPADRSICGLKLLEYEALSSQSIRAHATDLALAVNPADRMLHPVLVVAILEVLACVCTSRLLARLRSST